MKSTVNLPAWSTESGLFNDIVLTSRCRLARSFADMPFPHKSSREQKTESLQKMQNIIQNNPFFSDWQWLELSELSPVRRSILFEEHILSLPFSREVATGRALCHNSGMDESMMINEEDHLRFQVLRAGLELKKCWMRINRIDDEIESEIDYAFSTEFGYKTACPTNMGCGLRASVMMHVPGIAISGNLEPLIGYVENIGMTCRGMHGEGSTINGNVIQLSNQEIEEESEEDIIKKMDKTCRHVIDRERNAREAILFEKSNRIQDRVNRDRAILKSARIIGFEEFMERLSMLRMGSDMEIITPIPIRILNRMLIFSRPAHLQTLYHGCDTEEKIDIARADMAREALFDY